MAQKYQKSKNWKLEINKKNCKKNCKIRKYNLFAPQKIAILLVLPFEEISIRPELSSPPSFRIQGG